MLKKINKAILYSFIALFFFVPLIVYPGTSELFEFNKMLFTYALTSVVVAFWVSRMIVEGKIIFKRTLLDIPLVIFLISQLLSTLVSFDPRTSLFGYYSRFHGGLLSSISYSFLYWALVSNIGKKEVKKTIYALLATAVPVSLYAVAQHFGIDKEVWVQDVQNRVFSTFGQPNWLASWLVALLPVTWLCTIKKEKRLLYLALSGLLFLAFLYTKSRSGILGFVATYVVFWGLMFLKKKREVVEPLAKITLVIASLTIVVGTPWSPSIAEIINKNTRQESEVTTGPVLETGGTESGEIRKIVWQGAVDIWKNYPILGTGVETFAYSYYNFRPVEHNLVSEWDFLYNKAHNEYLNIAATTGTFGILSYLALIAFSIYLFYKKQSLFSYALLSGYVSILVTNFFGFSVVPVSLSFFLYPAMAAKWQEKDKKREVDSINGGQKVALVIVSLTLLYLLFSIGRYWYADTVYAKGKRLNDVGNPVEARDLLIKATEISPRESVYWEKLSDSTSDTAVFLSEESEGNRASEAAHLAEKESERAVTLSPKNVNLLRSRASMFIKLATINENYLFKARETLFQAIDLAPTDAKLYYNLGLTEARIGNLEEAKYVLRHTIEIKNDYRNARLALALLLSDEGRLEEAKEQLNYILENLNPEDNLAKQTLEEIE